MKKEQIILIRILSVVFLLSVMSLILIFGAGNGLFQNIVNDINHNIVDVQSGAASIYNIYYYKGLNVIYMILFSITLFSAGLAIVSILTRYNTAVLTAKISCIFMILTGMFIIFARIMEGSKALHRFIAGFYMDDVSGTFETARLMHRIPLSGIFLILLAVLCLLMIRSSRINTIKVYKYGDKLSVLAIYVPVLFSAIFIKYLREILISVRCISVSNEMDQVNTFLNDYYFSNQWGFNWNYAWFLVVVSIILVGCRVYLSSEKGKMYGIFVTTIVPFILLTIRSIIFYMNSPKLFGFLTFDEHICDLTEQAYLIYLIRFVLDVLILTSVLEWLIIKKEGYKKILISYGINVVISILGIIVLGNLFGIAGMYIACIIANIITLVCNFYVFYVSRSHH